MEKPIIEIKSIAKRYIITHHHGRYIALRDVIAETIFHPIRSIRNRVKKFFGKDTEEEFWSLRNINLSINKGEAIGIIGPNGAGKSTLLKILTKITPPTQGEIILRGRVASLLEVGTGFHPELTGRDNIYLNGAILGMTRREIESKFDDIVDFAGIERFLDTPVKRYSSGMYVRLAFSVAAHLEPDILLVDEVLAVGDAEFQKKCLGKMSEVTKKAHRTIVLVSHNMAAIQRLCTKTIFLKEGEVIMFDETKKVIAHYLNYTNALSNIPIRERKDRTGSQGLIITDVYLETIDKQKTNQVISGEYTKLVLEYTCKSEKAYSNIVVGANITNDDGVSLTLLHNGQTSQIFDHVSGSGSFVCTLPRIPLVPGKYMLSVRVTENGRELDNMQNILNLEILPGDFFGTGTALSHSYVYFEQSWTHEKKTKNI